jgi:Trypsin-like peptidase domain
MNYKRTISIASTLGFLLLFSFNLSAQHKSQIVKVVGKKKTHLYNAGTGFLLNNDGIITTCYHIIQGVDSIEVTYEDSNGNTTLYKYVEIVSISPEYDLAQLYCERLKNVGEKMKTDTGKIKLDEIEVWGFPRDSDKLIMSGKTEKDGFTQSRYIQEKSGTKIFNLLNVDLIPLGLFDIQLGMSGGPVIQNGSVIGVFEGSYETGGGSGWAIPLKYLKELQPVNKQSTIKEITSKKLILINDGFIDKIRSSILIAEDVQQKIKLLDQTIQKYEKHRLSFEKFQSSKSTLSEEINMFLNELGEIRAKDSKITMSEFDAPLLSIGNKLKMLSNTYINQYFGDALPIISFMSDDLKKNEEMPVSMKKITRMKEKIDRSRKALNNFMILYHTFNTNRLKLSNITENIKKAVNNYERNPSSDNKNEILGALTKHMNTLKEFLSVFDKTAMETTINLPRTCLDFLLAMYY